MNNSNIVKQATKSARRAVLLAIIGAAVVITALILEHSIFSRLQVARTAQMVELHQNIGKINRTRERLNNAANMAAVTGDASWDDEYEAELPKIQRALDRVAELADPRMTVQLDTRTRISGRKIIEVDKQIFEKVAQGNLTEAQALLSHPTYQFHQQNFSVGTERFMADVATDAEAWSKQFETRERVALAMLAPLSLIAAFALWRHLNASLARSEGVHLAAEAKIRRLAMNDMLTGLSNRMSLRESLHSAMARAAQANTKVAVLMIDLDRFKPVNDRYGHLVGDLVLKEVAKRLIKAVRNGELCGRFGGDEFVAVVEYSGDDQIPRRIGARVVEALSAPMALQGLTVEIGASVGMAVFPGDATAEDDLIGKADIALYKAKSSGRGTVQWFNASMDTDIKMRLELEAELGSAIKNREIVPYYQPIVDLASGRIASFEVLSRWHHPARGTIQPSEFIPLAEKCGLIDELMLSVLQRACLDVRALPPELTIAINIAPGQIQDARLAHRILAVLSRTHFAPVRLEVEITESALISDIEAAKSVIDSLKSLGIKVALDDFGTGYSSLSYLSDLPFDKIKIDRSFIKTVHDRRESVKIVSAIVGLGRSLGALTVAEGIETARDEEVIRALSCSLAQGYYYSKPVPATDLPSLVRRFDGPVRRAVAAISGGYY
ncbi:MAG: EAL domain-containing protein [Hyphomicrobium sp.]|jgi:diguanylate cyclase (GGDEF)-like protein